MRFKPRAILTDRISSINDSRPDAPRHANATTRHAIANVYGNANDATSGHTPHSPTRHSSTSTRHSAQTAQPPHHASYTRSHTHQILISYLNKQQNHHPSSQSGHWLNVQHPSPQGHASQIIFTPCASARILPATESATATAAANSPERAQAPCRLAHASQGRTVTAPTPASSHHRRLHYHHHHHHLATAPDCTVAARVRHAGWPTR
jgi:hypothetical protein